MSSIKMILGISLSILLLTTFGGCAATNSGNVQTKDRMPVGYKYYPKLPTEIESIDAAKNDLAELLNSRKQPGVTYHGQQGINTHAGANALTALMQGARGGVWAYYNSSDVLLFMAVDGFSVRAESIEVSPRIAFFYTDLTNTPIVVEKILAATPAYVTPLLEGSTGIGSVILPYEIDFPGLMSFHFEDMTDAQRFADDLFFIQQKLDTYNKERLTLFQSKAAQYRTLKVKPPVSEEQRKYIVQANASNEHKDYAGAIELYGKAIDVDPVSYPEGYFNLALLSARMQRFKPAIGYMKQYLFLEPGAKDARSAQDKIYEWEMMLQR